MLFTLPQVLHCFVCSQFIRTAVCLGFGLARYAHAQLVTALVRTGLAYSNQKIEFAIDLITGGLVAHAHALLAALAASVPANYFFWGFPK